MIINRVQWIKFVTSACAVLLGALILPGYSGAAPESGIIPPLEPGIVIIDPCTLVGQENIDQCAINTFNGYLNNKTWSSWSSTSDLLDQKNPGDFGSRFVPKTCTDYLATVKADDKKNKSKNYSTYAKLRVLSQVGKVNDSIFEAGAVATKTYTWEGTGHRSNPVGLSSDPVLAANGQFLRYEILLNPIAYNWVIANSLYKASALDTWSGDLIFPLQSQVVKNAWVEHTGTVVSGLAMHTEDLLVYTSASFNSTKTASCVKKTMALVGQHLVTKTSNNPAWTWATFEHNQSAPYCTAADADGTTGGVNLSCPASPVSSGYILNDCATGVCSTCNTPPTKASTKDCASSSGYCVDKPKISKSQLCRQLTNTQLPSIAAGTNYQLISTQWYKGSNTGDVNNAPSVRPQGNRGNIRPTTVGGKSLLGNSSMESYERSNCIGCHSSSVYTQPGSTAAKPKFISTDFMFWMTIEVPCGANGNNKACMD